MNILSVFKISLIIFSGSLLISNSLLANTRIGTKPISYLLKLNIAPELKKTSIEKRLRDQLMKRCHSIKDIDPGSLRIEECHSYVIASTKAPFMVYVEVKKPPKKGQWSFVIELAKRETNQNFKTVVRSQFDEPTKFMRDRGIRGFSEDEIIMVIRDRVIAFTFK